MSRIEFTLCREFGYLADDRGACPIHHGDACLMQFIPKRDAFDAFASTPFNLVRIEPDDTVSEGGPG